MSSSRRATDAHAGCKTGPDEWNHRHFGTLRSVETTGVYHQKGSTSSSASGQAVQADLHVRATGSVPTPRQPFQAIGLSPVKLRLCLHCPWPVAFFQNCHLSDIEDYVTHGPLDRLVCVIHFVFRIIYSCMQLVQFTKTQPSKPL